MRYVWWVRSCDSDCVAGHSSMTQLCRSNKLKVFVVADHIGLLSDMVYSDGKYEITQNRTKTV